MVCSHKAVYTFSFFLFFLITFSFLSFLETTHTTHKIYKLKGILFSMNVTQLFRQKRIGQLRNTIIEASKQGKDEAVCGMCPHRHHLGGACYVTLFQAPLQVWKSYHKGNYPKVDDMSIFEGMSIRFGAYGDPNVLPMDLLEASW